jgi:hypothetical protein
MVLINKAEKVLLIIDGNFASNGCQKRPPLFRDPLLGIFAWYLLRDHPVFILILQ